MAEDVIQEPFAAINADDFYGADSFQVLAKQLQSGGVDYSMVGFVLRNTLSEFGSVARGVCRVDEANHLQTIVELTKIEKDGNGAKYTGADGTINKLSGDEPVSMNMWSFTPAIFPHLRREFTEFLKHQGQAEKSECYIPSVVGDLIRQGHTRCRVLRSNASWFGVTYREDRPRVVQSIRDLITKGLYPEKLWS